MRKGRRSIRLAGYDYSQNGAYFITICTQNREYLFGNIVDGELVLNEAGRIVADEWEKSAIIRNEIELDEYVIMPNHLHGIVFMDDHGGGDRTINPVGAHGRAPLRRQPKSIGSLIAGFKSAATKRINALRGTPGAVLWQRNYYEHVVRDENELNRIREYIIYNPMQWETDRENLNETAGGSTPIEPWKSRA